jgi:uncharacterized protein
MEFEWEEAKDRANREKHGIGLGEAAGLDWDVGMEIADFRRDYGEVRTLRYAYVGSRLFVYAFTSRQGKRRIISLRRANAREIRKHGKTDAFDE